MGTVLLRSGMVPVEVLCTGATVTNQGPSTVYYADQPDVSTTSYDGSLASGASATLEGVQHFVCAVTDPDGTGTSRADLLVGPSPLLGSGSPAVLTIDSRDSAGNPTSVTEGGVTTTYTWNSDGTPATETRLGVTRTFTYSAGILTGATVS